MSRERIADLFEKTAGLFWRWVLPAILLASIGYDAAALILYGMVGNVAASILICETLLASYVLIRRQSIDDYSKLGVGILWAVGLMILFAIGVVFRPWYAPVNILNACTALGMILMVSQGR